MSASVDLQAGFKIGKTNGSADLLVHFIVRQAGSVDLSASMEIAQWVDLNAHLMVRQPDSVDLSAEFIARQAASAPLKAIVTVRHSTSVELKAILSISHWVDLDAEAVIRHSAFADLGAECTIRHSDSSDIPAKAIIRHSDAIDLQTEFIVRHSEVEDLPAEVIIRHSNAVDLQAQLVVRHSDAEDLKAKLIIRHSSSEELKTIFGVSHWLDLKAVFGVSHWVDLPAKMTVRHSAIANLTAELRVRGVYPLWTTRKIINGVINIDHDFVGDFPLEDIIEGVMFDVKTIMASEDIDYSGWTGATVPFQIIRATTYGVCASLYARSTKTFQSRVIPTLAPVTVTVISDAERAMEYWEKKMQDALERYYASIDHPSITTTTTDEEPIFTMSDIASTTGDDAQWRRDFGMEA